MDKKSKIILISGPTGSGKSNFAVQVSEKIKGEIINADSMQIYKEFKILTARPLKKDQKKIKHYLYGIISANKNFSVGSWLKLAIKKIRNIQKKGKIPVLVGGTGLYFKALIEGLAKIPSIPYRVRKETRLLHEKIGQQKFYNLLKKIDKNCKNKIDPNDIQRTMRAYEIIKHTKISLFDWYKNTKPKLPKNSYLMFYIDYPKDQLVIRINKRVDKMIKDGAIGEVKRLLKLKISKNNNVRKVIGFREIFEYLEKKHNLMHTIDRICIKTRQYAKRQRTWARGQMANWQKVNPNNLKIEIKKIQNYISKT